MAQSLGIKISVFVIHIKGEDCLPFFQIMILLGVANDAILYMDVPA